MYCTIPLKNRKCIIQSINCTLQQQQGFGGSFRYCTSSLYHLNLSPFYQTPLQAVCRYKVTYGVIKCMFSASIELALLRDLDKFSQFSKGSFNPSGVLLTQFAWIAPAWGTGSDRTKFHWHDKISYQVLSKHVVFFLFVFASDLGLSCVAPSRTNFLLPPISSLLLFSPFLLLPWG